MVAVRGYLKLPGMHKMIPILTSKSLAMGGDPIEGK